MVSVQRHVSLLRGVLREAERERFWVRAERLPQGHAGAVLLTDRRLLFSGSGFVQQSQEGWPLAGVAVLRLDRLRRRAALRVTVPGGTERFTGAAADMGRLADAIGAATAAPDGDLASGLERLADLHRAGELSDAEFALAKRRLLE